MFEILNNQNDLIAELDQQRTLLFNQLSKDKQTDLDTLLKTLDSLKQKELDMKVKVEKYKPKKTRTHQDSLKDVKLR